ncbi:MAG: RecQ family ATP-dependent DNA helicase [Gemmatimonadota bacterium]
MTAGTPTLALARRVLSERYGHDDFRGVQGDVVRAALAGRDVLALMPTGAGKSVCFQIPALLAPGTTLVVSPLISLMTDQVDRLRALGVEAAALHGALEHGQRERTLAALAAGALKLLYVAPERFGSRPFARALAAARVARLAVDEAHCIVSWGRSFRPAYRGLGAVRARLGCPCTALTATATPAVRTEIVAELGLIDPATFATGVDRPNLRWEVERLRGRRAKDLRLLNLVRGERAGRVLVYAATRRTTDALADLLRGRGVDAVAYHAGVSDAERARLQRRFLGGDARVVVATSAFGMGIDRPDVRAVVHYDMPGALEDYVQEAGRAGRDGLPSRCVLLYAKGDERVHVQLGRQSHPPPALVRAVLSFLRARAVTGAPPHGASSLRLRPVEVMGAVRGLSGPQQLEAAIRVLREEGLVAAGRPDARGGVSLVVEGAGGLSRRGRARRREALARERESLAAMRAYARARTCRRALILAHFAEPAGRGPCSDCDVCAPAGPRPDPPARTRRGRPLCVGGVRS